MKKSENKIGINEKIKKRNINIDIIRGLAILMIVIYHIYCVTGVKFKYNVINSIIGMGGEIGVTTFFILSGYSIYSLLNKKKMTYSEYIKGRLKRILPHYYLSLFFIVLLSSSVIYLTIGGIINLISHTFLFHNLFYSMHGSINGVCWTLGVIFQFYLIAPFIKKIFDKKPILTIFFSIIISFSIKAVLYLYVFPKNDANSMYYFIYGRQLFTALEAFVFGMAISKYDNNISKRKFLWLVLSIIAFLLVIGFALYGINYHVNVPIEIYSSSLKGVLFSIIFAMFISLFIYAFSQLKLHNTFLHKIILFISKHEYAIYIWHLFILSNLYSNNDLLKTLTNNNPIIGYFILLFLLIMICWCIDCIVSSLDIQLLIAKINEVKKNIITTFFILLMIYTLFKIWPLIGMMIKNFQSNNLTECDTACQIEKKYYKQMVCKEKKCKYLLIDDIENGFLNYYKLRYKLVPHIPYNFNSNFYTLIYEDDKMFLDYIKNLDCDYVIVINSERLKNNGYDIENSNLYKINNKSNNIQDLLIEVTK